jgi:hypothetical protein
MEGIALKKKNNLRRRDRLRLMVTVKVLMIVAPILGHLDPNVPKDYKGGW